MSMDSLEFLLWVRGPGLQLATGIFLLGLIIRLFEIFSLGRSPNLAQPRHRDGATGMRTLFRRFLFPQGMARRSPVTYIGGYIFHIGLFIVVFLFIPHIALVRDLTGLSWPGLPTPVVDAITVVTMVAMVVILMDRLSDPVKRFISTAEDYLIWALTILPLITGYLAIHNLLLPYTTMLALHILSVELLLAITPFTKLMHFVTLFTSRWYNGEISGHKGVRT